MPAAQNVAVQVRDRFAPVRTVIDHEAVPVGQTQLFGDLRGLEQQMAEKLVLVRTGLGDAGNMLLGNNQHVRRGLRIDVAEGEHEVVLVNNVGGDFARGNFLEQGLLMAWVYSTTREQVACSRSALRHSRR